MAAPAQHSVEPERLYRIGDVSRLTDTKPFVLRFWETEFPMLQPVKTPKGHRLYRQQDIDLILAIKRLLYNEGFTIPGARRHLAEQLADVAVEAVPAFSPEPHPQPELFAPPPFNESLTHAGRGTACRAPAASTEDRPPLTSSQAETLGAVREELRAILTLLGTG